MTGVYGNAWRRRGPPAGVLHITKAPDEPAHLGHRNGDSSAKGICFVGFRVFKCFFPSPLCHTRLAPKGRRPEETISLTLHVFSCFGFSVVANVGSPFKERLLRRAHAQARTTRSRSFSWRRSCRRTTLRVERRQRTGSWSLWRRPCASLLQLHGCRGGLRKRTALPRSGYGGALRRWREGTADPPCARLRWTNGTRRNCGGHML